uniref:Uncharacterized protein n=1 Tax=Inonotus obliquus TaxID=167356 RepID=A0A5A4UC03_9AGAM|nr:hypothetical protein [Inonotus obliquus]BBN21290.1 hypothetical protein [Inonotus obliquus]
MVSAILIPVICSFILMVSENLTDSVSLLFVINSHLGLGTASFQKRKASTSKAKKATKTVKEAVKEVPVAYPVKTPDIKPSEPSKGLFSRLLSGSTVLANSFRTNLNASQATSSFKSLCKTCTTLKTNLKNFFWSILVFIKLDRFITPKVLFVLSLIGGAFKWLMRGFTLFNLIMFAWIFYFNTPVITAQLLTGWLLDFCSKLKITYTDTVARFLDYLINVAENGLRSVPKHPKTPVEYPEGGFYKQYREIFKMIQDEINNS